MSQGTDPSSLRKLTSWLPSLAFPLPDGCPQGVGAGLLGGAFNSQYNLLTEILHKLMQFMISEVTKLCLGDDVAFPHLGEGYHGVNGVLLPLLRVESRVLKSLLPLL